MKVDYIIVGQGIAGSMLAWFLLKSGCKILIIDDFDPNSSSRVASGIVNPITGKRLVKSWKIDELLPFAADTYRRIENELNVSIFSNRSICRIFSNNEDFQFFRQKMELEELPDYVKPLNSFPGCFKDSSFGGITVSKAYQLDYPALLDAVREFFIERDMLLAERFHFENLELKSGAVFYKKMEASKIIFCEGWKAQDNPYFKWLPFNFAKGEVMTVKMDRFPKDNIWHKGIFIIPYRGNLFRIGATYEWKFSNSRPSEAGRKELETRLRKAVNIPFEIVQHNAAVRPTVIDRRPLIGVHPYYKELVVFNGLGTKGASLAPYYANQLSNFLIGHLPLDKEVDILRFSKETFFPG